MADAGGSKEIKFLICNYVRYGESEKINFLIRLDCVGYGEGKKIIYFAI